MSKKDKDNVVDIKNFKKSTKEKKAADPLAEKYEITEFEKLDIELESISAEFVDIFYQNVNRFTSRLASAMIDSKLYLEPELSREVHREIVSAMSASLSILAQTISNDDHTRKTYINVIAEIALSNLDRLEDEKS